MHSWIKEFCVMCIKDVRIFNNRINNLFLLRKKTLTFSINLLLLIYNMQEISV